MGQPPLITLWMYWPAAFLAALGFVILYFALMRDRAKGRLRCPKCWYDMSGISALPARCPECGYTANTNKDLGHTHRRWLAAIAGCTLFIPLGAVFANLHAKSIYYAVMPKWKLSEELRWNGTTISRYRVRDPEVINGGERIVVGSGDKTLLDREDFSISIVEDNRAQQPFVDLNNDGVKEMIAECHSGGTHCCVHVFVIELRSECPVIVADIDAQSGVGLIPPANGRREWLLNIPDESFRYWRASSADSPQPSVHYRLVDGSLRIDLESMEEAVPLENAIGLANEGYISASDDGGKTIKPILWRVMLDLIYGVREPQAWIYFDRNWRGDAASKESFRKDFLNVLATDPWYQDLVAARAARDAGKPIAPSIVGISGRQTHTLKR